MLMMSQYSVWRTLNTSINDDDYPLALCHPRSISVRDLQEVHKIGKDFVSESYYLHPGQGHEWF